MNNKSGHGGFRTGAGRKKGTKVSKNTTVFYANCTEEEKKQLKEFLNKLRGLSVILLLIFTLPCFAAESSWTVEAPQNLPQDVHIQIEPGFVYAGGLDKRKVKSPNSFKISAYRDGDTQYAFTMNDATITIDNKQYRLLVPSSYYYIYNEREIAQRTIYKGPRNVYPFYVAPLENLRYTKTLDRYNEATKSFLIGAYVFPVKFNHKESVLKDKTDCLINIPLFNKNTFQTENLIFKITF